MCLDCDTAHRSDGFVGCRENPRLAERRRDAVPVHVGPKVRANAREDHADPLARQIIEQIANALRSGAVHVRDRAGIDMNQRTGVGALSTRAPTSSVKRLLFA